MPDKSKNEVDDLRIAAKGRSSACNPRKRGPRSSISPTCPKARHPTAMSVAWFRSLLLDARDKPDVKRESLGEKDIDGRRVVGFRHQ